MLSTPHPSSINTEKDFSCKDFAAAALILCLLGICGFRLFTDVHAPAQADEVVEELKNSDVVAILDNGPSMAVGAVEEKQGPYIQMQDGITRLYFAWGKSALPPGTEEALNHMVNTAQTRKKKLLVGPAHIAAQEQGHNNLLALNKERVNAIHKSIRSLGMPASQIQSVQTSVEAEADVDTSRTHFDIWVAE